MYRRILFLAVIPHLRTSALRATAAFLLAVAWALACREASPFLEESTNILLIIAPWQIALTYFGALITVTGTLDSLGLSDVALAIFLLLVNLFSSASVLAWCQKSYRRSNLDLKQRRLATEEDFIRVQNVLHNGEFRREIADERHAVDEFPPQSSGQPSSVFDLLEPHLVSPQTVQLVKRVGSGSLGEVFQGLYRGENVAVKQMLEFSEKNAREFREEILFTANLRHANIVNFAAACWDREFVALIIEWAPKGTLADMLGDPDLLLTWSDTLLPAARDVTAGMQYLHHGTDHGVLVHRDLKPDNCLLTEFLRVKISDFGTSRALADDDTRMTAVGTPLFCA
jgi:hypothetical protein